MAYGSNPTAQGVGAGEAAIKRFTEMIIDRMEQMKGSDWKKGG